MGVNRIVLYLYFRYELMRRILYILGLLVLLASCDQRLEIDDPKEEVQNPLPDGGGSSEDGDSDIDSGGSDTGQEGTGGNQGGSEGGQEGSGGDESGSEGGSEGTGGDDSGSECGPEGSGDDQEGAGGDQDGSGPDNGGSDGIEGDDTGGDDGDGDSDMDDGDNGSEGGNTDDGGGNSDEGGGSGGDMGSSEDSDGDSDGGSGEDSNSGEEGDSDGEVETGLTVRFAEGVSQESGWYDVNKVKDGTVNGDINMCWAATAANILQWWQDRYVEQGNELPEGCPDGKGETYELAIMEVFHSQWDNTYGGHAFHAVKWYFEGVNVCEGWNRQAQPLQRGSGGYFKHAWEQIEPYMYTGHALGYTQDYNNYYLWGSGSGLNAAGRLKAFTELVELFIDKGMTSMAIAQRENYGGVHHSVTLWGYEKDNETGLLTRIWITDSDDSAQWPREPVLHEYKVSSTESGAIKFSGDVYAACYPVSLYPVSGYLSVR